MQTCPCAVKVLDDALDEGHFDDGKETSLGSGLRGRVGTVSGASGVKSVDCTSNVVSLRDLDAVGEDLDGEWIVGNLFSISIQFRRGWILSRSHPLWSVPYMEKGQKGRTTKHYALKNGNMSLYDLSILYTKLGR